MKRWFFGLLAGCALIANCALIAHAQDQTAPAGFSAKGTIVVQAAFSGQRYTVGIDMGIMQRGSLYRFDVNRIALPGADPALSALAQQFLPQGSFSALYDYTTRRTTVWSNANKTFTVLEPKTSAPVSVPSPPTASGPDIFKTLTFGKDLQKYKVYDVSLRLTGASQANGHRTRVVAVSARIQPYTGQAVDANGNLNFADDLDGFLTRANLTFRQPQRGSLQLDLTSVTRTAPAQDSFAVPGGYRKVDDLAGVLGKNIPIPH